jgi:hypothetical protein
LKVASPSGNRQYNDNNKEEGEPIGEYEVVLQQPPLRHQQEQQQRQQQQQEEESDDDHHHHHHLHNQREENDLDDSNYLTFDQYHQQSDFRGDSFSRGIGDGSSHNNPNHNTTRNAHKSSSSSSSGGNIIMSSSVNDTGSSNRNNMTSAHLSADHESFRQRLIDDVLGNNANDKVPMEKVVMLIWQFRDDPTVVRFMTRFVAKVRGVL